MMIKQENGVSVWRDIASAPKDGTMIDLWHGEFGRQADCYWGNTHHCCGEAGHYCDDDWHSESEGWVHADINEILFDNGAFTHWMPTPPGPSCGGSMEWRDVASAPSDGTLLTLLVRPYANDHEGAWTPFDDSLDPYLTIGFNNLDNTGEDRWQFAGWCWSHDHIIEGDGEILGWAPFAQTYVAVANRPVSSA